MTPHPPPHTTLQGLVKDTKDEDNDSRALCHWMGQTAVPFTCHTPLLVLSPPSHPYRFLLRALPQ